MNKAFFEEKRAFFDSGATRSYEFRKEQLIRLRAAIKELEKEISEALYKDLRKSAMESYMLETGPVLAEIDHAVKHLKSWMKPKKQDVPLALEPSTCYTQSEPRGVVFIISPWNYPFLLSLIAVVGAVAAGNCIVLKPSEDAPASAEMLEKIFEKAFDKDFASVVQGLGHEVVPSLMDEHTFNHVFFTGSTQIGSIVAQKAAEKLTSTTLELGGKSPAVIDKSVNLKVAAKRIVWGKFTNAGQACVAPDYLIVEESIKDQLVNELIKTIESAYGKSQEDSEDYPRIINQKQFNRVKAYLQDGKILYGGNTKEDDLYVQPTLLENTPLDSQVMKEEIFGPILPILTFKSKDEIKLIISHNPYPLACYYFGSDKKMEDLVMNEVQFGGGCVNNCTVHLGNPDLPFGGIQTSGAGNYHGKYGFDCFSHVKGIVKTATWFDPPIKYAPFNKGKFNLIRKALKLG